MADSVTVRLFGDDFQASLRNMDPKLKPKLTSRILIRSGQLIVKTVQTKTIKRGGTNRPLPNKLTSRTGFLRRSQHVNRISPTAVEAGTDAVYGPVHEQGGRINVPAHSRRVEGRNVAVKSYTANFPRRPFLEPALALSQRGIQKIMEQEWLKVIGEAPVRLPPGGVIR